MRPIPDTDFGGEIFYYIESSIIYMDLTLYIEVNSYMIYFYMGISKLLVIERNYRAHA